LRERGRPPRNYHSQVMKNFDVIVAGLGAMGSAALCQLAGGGASVLGIDRFEPPHDRGSTHGETRITRAAIGEGEEFVPLVLRSNEIWEVLSERTGRQLLNRTGLLIFSEGGGGSVLHGKDILGETIRIAGKFSIPHEVLDGNALRTRFPSLSFGPDASGYFEPGAGYLVPELCVQTNLEEARRLGARLNVNEAVLAVASSEGGVRVTTDKDTYECSKIIVSAGAWVRKLLGHPLAEASFRISRQAMFWFETGADYSEEHFPVYIKAGDDEHSSYYGFPAVGGSSTVKMGFEQFAQETDPDTVDRTVSNAEFETAFNLLSGNFRIRREGARAKTCLYTVTEDFGFVIDFLPENENVLVVSPCSGHGFKHSAGIGLLAKQLVLGEEPFADPSAFRFS